MEMGTGGETGRTGTTYSPHDKCLDIRLGMLATSNHSKTQGMVFPTCPRTALCARHVKKRQTPDSNPRFTAPTEIRRKHRPQMDASDDFVTLSQARTRPCSPKIQSTS